MKLKRIISLILTVTMLLALAAMSVSAADNTVIGYSDSLVVKKDDFTGIPKASELIAETPNTTATAYIIEDEADLLAFASYINTVKYPTWIQFAMRNVTFYLTKDITMTAPAEAGTANFQPINLFSGTFDGQGHTIDGIKVVSNDTSTTFRGIGLFEVLYGGTVKNLILGSNCSFTYTGTSYNFVHDSTKNEMKVLGIGSIAGTMYGDGNVYSEITNCYSSATVIGNGNVGGIVGCLENRTNNEAYKQRVSHCTFDGSAKASSITNSDGEAGGIVGETQRPFLITNCHNRGEINGQKSSGAILGNRAAGNPATIDYCKNEGQLTGGDCGGGIFMNRASGGASLTSYVGNIDIIGIYGAQANAADGVYAVRFLATLNTLELQEVGFKVQMSCEDKGTGEVITLPTTTVYNAVTATNAGGSIRPLTAEAAGGAYLAVQTITGIPEDMGNMTFTVTAYQIDLNGVETLGTPVTFVYDAAAHDFQ